ncbi:MAG: UPF0489 family protein [Candidatus Pacearchaeota archaeon]|jgi:hypothetical protein
MNFSNQKGLLSIKTIPLAITEEHHKVLAYWRTSKIIDADLLHIDAHHDMNDNFSLNKNDLTIANFICPAFYEKIISSVYWINPQSEEKRIQDFGSRYDKDRLCLDIYVDDYHKKVRWRNINQRIFKSESPKPKKIQEQELILKLNSPVILDIDLDAFCCHRNALGDKAIYNYELRISQTCELLNKLKKPSLITITRSQGKDCYVPRDRVDSVQERLINKLVDLYS